MTGHAETVLRFLADGLKLRRSDGASLLERSDYIFNCPGGIATIQELVSLGYVDDRDNLTESGLAVAKSLTASNRKTTAEKAGAATAKMHRAKTRAKQKEKT